MASRKKQPKDVISESLSGGSSTLPDGDRVCRRCGNKNLPNAAACWNCGADLGPVQTSEPASEEASAAAPSSAPTPPPLDASAPQAEAKAESGAPAAQGTGRNDPVAMLGFSSSGKTVYLTMLYHSLAEASRFAPGWSAEWIRGDGGHTAAYLRRFSAQLRGVRESDRAPDYVIDEGGRPDFSRIRRRFPEGTTEQKRLHFALTKTVGLEQFTLNVETMDVMGEALHRAVVGGGGAADEAHNEALFELCQRCRVLMIFLSVLRIDQHDDAGDLCLMMERILARKNRLRAVAFVVTGIDALSAASGDLDAWMKRQQARFATVLTVLQRHGVAYEFCPVSSLGGGVTRRKASGIPPSCDRAGHWCFRCQELVQDVAVDFTPINLAAPWEFAFRHLHPAYHRYPSLAIATGMVRRMGRAVASPIGLVSVILLMLLAGVLWYRSAEASTYQAALEETELVGGDLGRAEALVARYRMWHGWLQSGRAEELGTRVASLGKVQPLLGRLCKPNGAPEEPMLRSAETFCRENGDLFHTRQVSTRLPDLWMACISNTVASSSILPHEKLRMLADVVASGRLQSRLDVRRRTDPIVAMLSPEVKRWAEQVAACARTAEPYKTDGALRHMETAVSNSWIVFRVNSGFAPARDACIDAAWKLRGISRSNDAAKARVDVAMQRLPAWPLPAEATRQQLDTATSLYKELVRIAEGDDRRPMLEARLEELERRSEEYSAWLMVWTAATVASTPDKMNDARRQIATYLERFPAGVHAEQVRKMNSEIGLRQRGAR